MTSDWKALKIKFQELLGYCTESSAKLNHDMLRPACSEAGKGAFGLIQEDAFGVEFNDRFKVEPMVYQKQDCNGNFHDLEHYHHYWLCVVGFLGRQDVILVGSKKLRNTKIPVPGESVCWEAYYHESAVENSFFSDNLVYLTETCRASIQTCDFILKQIAPESLFPQCPIEVEVENRRIKDPSGQWYTLTEVQTDLLNALFKAKGAWIKGRELPAERPDKIRKDMPKKIQDLIESHKQHGYRIPSLLSK